MRIAIFAAHSDDETLGCGGTIARLAQEGHEVTVCISAIRHLEKECRQVCEMLGVKTLLFKQFPDQMFETEYRHIQITIEAALKDVQPEVVYTHHHGDLNLDHQIISKTVLTATRPKPGCTVKEVYLFEVPSSTDWSFGYTFAPNVFVDIKDTLSMKLDAMEIYQSEVLPYPHPRSRGALTAIAQRWGNMVGLHQAEAFQLVRSLR